jgi:hypothetical protein
MAHVDAEEVIVKAKSTLAPASNPVPQTSMSQAQCAVNHSDAEGIEVLCMDNPAHPTTGESGATMDIQSLCLSQDFKSMTDVTKVVTSVSICKPNREWFFRVHPDFERYMAILEVKSDKEFYIVDPKLLPQLSSEATPKLLVLGVSRQGKFFFWPLKVEADRGLDEWSKSAVMAMWAARKNWTKMKSNMDVGHYETFTAKGDLGQPEWPEDISELLQVAFRDRIISTMDHPVIKRLNGEI